MRASFLGRSDYTDIAARNARHEPIDKDADARRVRHRASHRAGSA